MGINDLLAQISGGGDKALTSRNESDKYNAPKRKAENELRSVSSKVQRTVPPSNGEATSAAESRRSSGSKASTLSRPAIVTATNTAISSTRPTKPLPPLAARGTTSAAAPVAKSIPKKGSYKEIMARAQKAQATMGQVGKIQHKAIEKGPSKRERQELKAQQAKEAKRGASGPGSRGRSAIGPKGGPSSQDQNHRNGDLKQHGGNLRKSPGARLSKPGTDEDKKPKKAALATTGYQGTARPRPGAAGPKPGVSAEESRRGSGEQGRSVAFSRAHRSRLDEYDEMDDFIDDDEEDNYGGGATGYEDGRIQRSYRHYMSDEEDESDMEAGMSDIDQEEQRAEYHARREDQEQDRIEQELRRKKEERKKRFMQLSEAKRAR